jgi:exoribonuclease II
VRLRDGQVVIHPTERLGSRELVTELMLMAGAGVADYCRERAIPIPYASQSPPDGTLKGEGMAEMYAFRRLMKPGQSKTLEEPHAGLGLPLYTRATSPLRRYLDLVTHQQVRAHLRGGPTLSREQVAERIGASEAVSGAVRKAERFSNSHWKMVFLQRNPGWRGRGVVVDLDDKKATLLIPELALETRLRLKAELPLNSEVRLAAREVNVPELNARFRILD